jgi:hypothetical protein
VIVIIFAVEPVVTIGIVRFLLCVLMLVPSATIPCAGAFVVVEVLVV